MDSNYNGEFDNPENYNYIKPYFEKGTSLNKILEKVFNFPLEHPSIDHEHKTITMDLWSGRQLLSLIIPKIKMTKKIHNTIMFQNKKNLRIL